MSDRAGLPRAYEKWLAALRARIRRFAQIASYYLCEPAVVPVIWRPTRIPSTSRVGRVSR